MVALKKRRCQAAEVLEQLGEEVEDGLRGCLRLVGQANR
jgi:hypothetical protein